MILSATISAERHIDGRLLRLALLLLILAGLLTAGGVASQLRFPAPPATPAEAPRVTLPHAPPRHWSAPPPSIEPESFVRSADERDLSWIRGDGY